MEEEQSNSGFDGTGTSVSAQIVNNKSAISKLFKSINEINSTLFKNDMSGSDGSNGTGGANSILPVFCIYKVPHENENIDVPSVESVAPAPDTITKTKDSKCIQKRKEEIKWYGIRVYIYISIMCCVSTVVDCN